MAPTQHDSVHIDTLRGITADIGIQLCRISNPNPRGDPLVFLQRTHNSGLDDPNVMFYTIDPVLCQIWASHIKYTMNPRFSELVFFWKGNHGIVPLTPKCIVNLGRLIQAVPDATCLAPECPVCFSDSYLCGTYCGTCQNLVCEVCLPQLAHGVHMNTRKCPCCVVGEICEPIPYL